MQTLMDLPYSNDYLAPKLSAETLEYHHGKHHAGYVNKLNDLIKGSRFEAMPLESMILEAEGAVFNNAAQIYNHNMYFEGLGRHKTAPSAELLELIERDFESLELFREAFIEKAAGLFGSGWVWLCIDKDRKLLIQKTCNANNPLRFGLIPLMTCDVWEHAYYIDYRNRRPDYLRAWWELINWNYVSENLARFNHADGQKYIQECPDTTMVCDYLDHLQENERIGS